MSQLTQITFKIIVVGNSSVGKSCLLMRYIDNQYTPNHYPTIGLQFSSKKIVVNQVSVKLQIWDTAGQETFRSIVRNFYKNSDAVFIVYSIADRKSFQAIEQWIHEAHQNTPQATLYVLIGAQKDLQFRREVDYKEGQQAMQKYKMSFFFQTSAQEDINIDLAFEQTAKQLFLNYFLNKSRQEQNTNNNNIKLQDYNKETASEEGESYCC